MTMENAASRFGQRLAHTEKKYRDQALKKLTVYLTKKSEWSDLEFDKLWKALFYCMWMSDKRPVQEELSSNLAALVHKIPTPALALSFVHSFLRTMHREWHGIDGLRLDKFYSLIRKFVFESIALLRDNDFDHALVQSFVSMVSTEIVSQLPNGLRMHLSDLFLDELWKAAGATVDTSAFLLLLEPFFTLLSSEYDKTIFKRVRELVFVPMLSTYKFGVQPPPTKKKKSGSSGATDGETDGETDDENQVFEHVELAYVQHRLFTIASADDTAERNRSGLYDLYGKFFAVTKVDSLKAAQDGTTKPKLTPKKRTTKEVEAVAVDASAAVAETPTKKSKKKKNRKRTSADVTAEDAAGETLTPVVETAVVETKKSKKQKIAEKTAAAVAVAEVTETKVTTTTKEVTKKVALATKDAKVVAKKEATTTKVEKVVESVKTAKVETESKTTANEKAAAAKTDKKTAAVDATAKETKPKKDKTSKKVVTTNEATVAPKDKKTKTAAEPTQPKKKAVVVVKSGVKFQRCAVCNGYGKGLVPAAKDVCAHCERSQKTQKKAAAAVAKKRKASELAEAAAAAAAEAASAKKVTFGKNKALPHDLSVKRLKASAKKEATPKDDATIKSVLKASLVATASSSSSSSSSSSVSVTAAKKSKKAGKTRMKAADFF